MSTRLLLRHQLAVLLIAGGVGLTAWGDEVQTTTGDRYRGTVVTVTNDTVVLKNEVLGVVKIPKSKVALVSFGHASPTTTLPPSKSVGVATNQQATVFDKDTQKILSQLQSNTNLINGIQAKFLAGAGTEANEMFGQMVNGLLSGKLSVGDIQAQAASAAAQLRAAQKDLGEDSSFAIDSYLAILDRFLAYYGTATNR